MATEYASPTFPFIEYDGTNAQEIVDGIGDKMGPPAVIVSADANGAMFTIDLEFMIKEMNMNTGDRIALYTGDVVTPTQWAAQYAKP